MGLTPFIAHSVLIVFILWANAIPAGLTQWSFMWFGPHPTDVVWSIPIICIIIIVDILPDFAEQLAQGFCHRLLRKARELKRALAPAAGLSKGTHDDCPSSTPKSVVEQHHHSCRGPRLSTGATLETVRHKRTVTMETDRLVSMWLQYIKLYQMPLTDSNTDTKD